MSALHEPAEWETSSGSAPIDRTDISPEIYRQVFVSLDLAEDIEPVIGITSAISGEGRTTIALGLASTLSADLGTRVVLVEVDLERPTLAHRSGLPPAPGLADVLRAGGRLSDVMHPVGENLLVVPAGTVESDASRLLHQLPVRDPFHSHHLGPCVTILDLPPIMNHSYSPLVARMTDALLLVVRAGVTPADVVREAIVRLEDQPPRGVVLNGIRPALPSWLSQSLR